MIKNYICKICHKNISIFSIKNHLKLHSLKKIYIKCNICHNNISSNSVFNHYNIHEKKKNFAQRTNEKKNTFDNNNNQSKVSDDKTFIIYKNKIYTNMNKDDILKNLDESIERFKYYKNMILNGKFHIFKEKGKNKYHYKFIKKIEHN